MRGEVVCSLITKSKFPDSSKKYPVLPSREFGRKALTYMAESEGPPDLEAKSEEIPCIFPVIREFGR